MCSFVLSYISGTAGVQLSTSSSAPHSAPAQLFLWQPNTRFVMVLALRWERGLLSQCLHSHTHEAFCLDKTPVLLFIKGQGGLKHGDLLSLFVPW